MKKIVTAKEMSSLDQNTIVHHKIDSLVLMERAALSVVRHLADYDLTHTLFVCGSGNNGGDGIAVARMLHLAGYSVSVYFAGSYESRSDGCIRQMEIADSYHIRWINNPDYSEYTTIVDALFGVGLSRDITGKFAEIIHDINASNIPVVAVDIPSGISADDGKIMGCAIRADSTITFAYEKVGQLLLPGKSYCGKLFVEDIGIYDEKIVSELKYDKCNKATEYDIRHAAYESLCGGQRYYTIDKSDKSLIPIRDQNGNKGTFGKVLLIAGSPQMPGASVLCGRTIMRMGAGMLKMVIPYENREVIATTIPEAMLAVYRDEGEAVEQIKNSLNWADVIVIGPGLGVNACAEAMVSYVLCKSQLPLVLDADALNIISRHLEWLKDCTSQCILTPHMGEMSRLLHSEITQLQENRLVYLQRFAEQYQIQCVLKDSVTCVSLPNKTTYINQTGNCGMATAGSGDVLTGMIGGLLAVGTPWEYAGALGVWIHGTAGDHYSEKNGTAALMAGDLIEELSDLRIGE